jgi:hypothetical protein
MELKEYIGNLQEVLKEHGNLEVVYSADDEGNYFGAVSFGPSIGTWNEEDQEFSSEDQFKEQLEEEIEEGVPEEERSTFEFNAVCIN